MAQHRTTEKSDFKTRATDPASLRLAGYVVSGVIALGVLWAGAKDASSINAFFEQTQNVVAIITALIASVAGANVDKSGARPSVEVVDPVDVRETVVEAVKDVMAGRIPEETPITAVEELRARIEAMREARRD